MFIWPLDGTWTGTKSHNQASNSRNAEVIPFLPEFENWSLTTKCRMCECIYKLLFQEL